MNTTKQKIEKIVKKYDLHISDGVDSCSGYDYEEMEKAESELQALIDSEVRKTRKEKIREIQQEIDAKCPLHAVCKAGNGVYDCYYKQGLYKALDKLKDTHSEG